MKSRKAFIWGASSIGEMVYNKYKNKDTILGFIDINSDKWNTLFNGLIVYNPDILKKTDIYDVILLGTACGGDIPQLLDNMGINDWELDTSYVDLLVQPRIKFLKNYSYMMSNVSGSVAEAGVFRGDFAKEINTYFPNRKCYLFDTFEGFDKRDLSVEDMNSNSVFAGNWNSTSMELVYNKMPNKDVVSIFKGYFPQTITDDILNDQYIFVNLDMDLYKPTLDGLKIFYPRMVNGGIILVHDYFSDIYPNVKKAIADFEKEIGINLHKTPIGDGISIAIIK